MEYTSGIHNNNNQSFKETSQCIHNTNKSQLNQSFNSTLHQTSYTNPILNEISEYKLTLKTKQTSYYHLIISLIVCLVSIFLININTSTYYNYLSEYVINENIELNERYLSIILNITKSLLFIVFIIFLISIFHSIWLLIVSSVKKLSLNVLKTKLSKNEIKLLGADLFEDIKTKTQQQQDDETLNSYLHPEPTTPSRNIQLPYFSLSSSPSQQSPIDTIKQTPSASSIVYNYNPETLVVHRSPSKMNDSINFNEKYINKYLNKLEETEKHEQKKQLMLYGSQRQPGDDLLDALDNYNYQQKRNLIDTSTELRNYQYQLGTKPVATLAAQVPFATSTITSPSTTAGGVALSHKYSSIEQLNQLLSPTTPTSPKLTHSPSSYQSLLSISPTNLKQDLDFDVQDEHYYEDKRQAIINIDGKLEQLWCKKFNITRVKLDIEREKLRRWITLTILKPIITEIDQINDRLVKLGCADMKIGNASIAQLNQLTQTNKSITLNTLSILMPYLELTAKQDYLMQRLKELSAGGNCLNDYHWNAGGYYKSIDWSDYLPTDANIVMHFFCTYMDSRLIKRFPNLKPFTSQYFHKDNSVSTSSTVSITSTGIQSVQVKNEPLQPLIQLQQQQQQPPKALLGLSTSHSINSKLYINEYKSNPPCYRVVFNKEVYDINTGRNNLFDAIICFLYFVKYEFNGMLGAVSLSSSGVNLLSVIE